MSTIYLIYDGFILFKLYILKLIDLNLRMNQNNDNKKPVVENISCIIP